MAIIPIGYSHGLGVEPVMNPKRFGNLLKAVLKVCLRYLNHEKMTVYGICQGKKMPIIGRIGMQLTMVDVTDYPQVAVGHIIELPARRTNISGLVEKRYKRAGKVVATSMPSMTAWRHDK